MDVSKVHRILNDFLEEEATGYQEALNKLIAALNAARNSSDPTELLEDTQLAVEVKFGSSRFNLYSYSNQEVLEKIGLKRFVGNWAKDFIFQQLNGAKSLPQIIEGISKFVSERQKRIKVMATFRTTMDSLGLRPHVPEDNYEIGLILPSSATNNEMVSVAEHLKEWNDILKPINELTGSGNESIKLTLVNNGSLEFFTEQPLLTAAAVATIIDKSVSIYKKILDIRTHRKALSELEWNDQMSETDTKQSEAKIFESEVRKISEECVKKYGVAGIEQSRLNELKIAVNNSARKIALYVDKGIVIEITPPQVPSPEEREVTEENRNQVELEKAEHARKVASAEAIAKAAGALGETMKLGQNILSLLASPGAVDEDGGPSTTGGATRSQAPEHPKNGTIA